jgi:hypothetical protein
MADHRGEGIVEHWAGGGVGTNEMFPTVAPPRVRATTPSRAR